MTELLPCPPVGCPPAYKLPLKVDGHGPLMAASIATPTKPLLMAAIVAAVIICVSLDEVISRLSGQTAAVAA